MEHPFGTLATDALKLYRHRLLHRGVHHGHQIRPRRPRANQPITLTTWTGVDLAAQGMACYFTLGGQDPRGDRGMAVQGDVIPFTPVTTEWDTLAWGYVTRWEAILPGYPAGTLLRYRIGAWADGQEEVYADFPNVTLSGEKAAQRHFGQGLPPEMDVGWGEPRPGTIFSLAIDLPGPPAWARDARIYHLFVDRFHMGNGRGWRQTADLLDFCGGTLHGVTEKLDYIQHLGMNCLWLSPIFPSPTHHGYDVTDFRAIEPRLGTADDLRRLLDGAHARGMRVLLDLVCNHVSNSHPIFQAAQADSRSPYRGWFTFDDSALGYRAFFDVASMPEVNLTHPDARQWMVENGLYWLREYDVDGFRLDYANGPGADFWTFFNRVCKAEKVDCFTFGEVVDTPDQLTAYIGRLDGCLDFQMADALRRTFGRQSWTEAQFSAFCRAHSPYFPADFVMPAFLDNHDMDRFLHIAGNRQEALLRALGALIKLPNPPILYYGTEIGLTQTESAQTGLHVSRVPMKWGEEQDPELLEQVRALIGTRKEGQGFRPDGWLPYSTGSR